MADTPASRPCPTCALLSHQSQEAGPKRTARVDELLHGNSPPLDVELSAFRLFLEQSPEILQDLDQKVAQTKEMLDHLIRARSQAEEHMNDAKFLLHPMRSLPNEILSEIFSYCVPNGSFDEDPIDSLDPRLPPWTLTRVSRRWRDLALSLPRLWTYFELDFDKHQACIISTDLSVYRMEMFFERSKDLPLDVFVVSEEDLVSQDPMLKFLETTIHRWKRLMIDMPPHSLQALSGHTFYGLHSLDLPPDVAFMSDIWLTLFNGTYTPALRVFQPDGPASLWQGIDRVFLPWSQLTTVIGFPAFDTDALKKLQEMSSLECLDVVIGDHYMPIDSVYSLPTLVDLSVQEGLQAKEGRLKEFLSALDLPSLNVLSTNFSTSDYRIHQLPSNLRGAAEKLTELHISCFMDLHPGGTQNLLTFLSYTQYVEHLAIDDDDITQQFAIGLTISSLRPPILPRLRILDIGACHLGDELDADISVLYDMLESRCSGIQVGRTSESVWVAGAGMPASLETLVSPRWLFRRKETRWKDIRNALKVTCGPSFYDND